MSRCEICGGEITPKTPASIVAVRKSNGIYGCDVHKEKCQTNYRVVQLHGVPTPAWHHGLIRRGH